jgi:8-oxo-dGTP pyrophosphatase MutT (NUDIX family)
VSRPAALPLALPSGVPWNPELRSLVTERLRAFGVRGHVGEAQRRAAVAVTLVPEGLGAQIEGLVPPTAWSDRPALILTRRSAALRNHAGQWALPGGRIDDGESPELAALRELHEEVGLRLDPAAVLGRLDDFVTRSGFAITPVVVWAGAVPALTANPLEVDSIHRVRVQELLREDAPMVEPLAGSEHPVLRMPVGDRRIAAPTAAFLYQFREVCLLGRDVRVAHYEQPPFAWR